MSQATLNRPVATVRAALPVRADKEEIRQRFDLVDFIGGYVRLQPAGNGRYRGCCPFHEEKTPSFYVFESQCYKCYGCGKFGDLFRFVQETEGISFLEAKNRLAQGGNLSFVPVQAPPRRRPVKPETTWQQELDRAGLQPLAGSDGERYLAKRGISLEAARGARVKYARSWFRHPSVIFPITGQDGSVVAVQGRSIKGTAKITKGLKSLGVFLTKGAFENGVMADGLAICEAPIDALSLLLLRGIPSIATCGSGLPLWLPDACRGTVWIATDSDKQGDADFEMWAPLLEAKRITAKRLKPNCKDWNDDLLQVTHQ